MQPLSAAENYMADKFQKSAVGRHTITLYYVHMT